MKRPSNNIRFVVFVLAMLVAVVLLIAFVAAVQAQQDRDELYRLCEKLNAEASFDFEYLCIRDGKVVYSEQ